MTEFFKYITSSVTNYCMAIAFVLLIYLLTVTFVKIVFNEISRVIFTVRIPIISPTVQKKDLDEGLDIV